MIEKSVYGPILSLLVLIGLPVGAAEAATITSSAINTALGQITLTNTSSTNPAKAGAKKSALYSIETSGSASGSFTETVTGFSTPYTFSATSGAGPTIPGIFTATISPSDAIVIDLSASLAAMGSAIPVETSTAAVSLSSVFSITNSSTDATILVNFIPSFQYTLSVNGSSPPLFTGLASTTLSNPTTGSMFSDMITSGTKSPPMFVGSTMLLASLSPGQSIEIVAGFTTSAQAAAVPEPSTYLLFGTGLLGLLVYGCRQRKKAA